jgi:hypothetical protein
VELRVRTIDGGAETLMLHLRCWLRVRHLFQWQLRVGTVRPFLQGRGEPSDAASTTEGGWP